MIDYSLYLCTDSEINQNYPIEECVYQAIMGGVTFVQIREKEKSTREIIEIAKKVKKVTDTYHIPLVINDNIEVVQAIDCDGIHIGQEDISCREARTILGKDKIIGVTVSTLEEAKKAISDGATYLGVGAMYQSQTKKDAKIVNQTELQKILNNCKIPIVIIGGINKETIPNFKNYSISGYAMIRAILAQDDIMTATQYLKKLIEDNQGEKNCK